MSDKLVAKLKLIFVDDDDHFNREKWKDLDVEVPNIWWIGCYSDQEVIDKLQMCQELPGVESVEVVYE